MDNAISTQDSADKRVIGRPFESGNPGRPKGSTNHLTKTVKETLLKVFNELQEDPEQDLTAFAKNYPRDFYNMAAKLIPQEISGQIAVTKTEIKLIFPEPRGTTPNNNSTENVGGN